MLYYTVCLDHREAYSEILRKALKLDGTFKKLMTWKFYLESKNVTKRIDQCYLCLDQHKIGLGIVQTG